VSGVMGVIFSPFRPSPEKRIHYAIFYFENPVILLNSLLSDPTRPPLTLPALSQAGPGATRAQPQRINAVI